MTVTLNATTTHAWTALMRSSKRALEHIEATLAASDLPPLAWYDALWEIEQAGQAGIRPFALQDRLLLPQYGMSRLLGRIEKAGLIARISCASDRRGHAVRITGQGRGMRKRIWPVYARCLQDLCEDQLSPTELRVLQGLLDRIAP